MRAPGVRGPEERRWAAGPATCPWDFTEPGASFPARTCFPAQTPFGGGGGHCRGPGAGVGGLSTHRLRSPLPHDPSCPATTLLAHPCLCLPVLVPPALPACSCFSCLSLPAPPHPTPPACPLGLATRQPLKLGPLIAGRELIDIYWGLHPLAADPFIFNKEEESCLPWEMGQ